MKYRYFVSFNWFKGCSHGTGDCEVILKKPVNDYDMIIKLKEKVREAIDIDVINDADITIVNFILFKDE